MTQPDLVVYGLGELGRFLAGGALRADIRVAPITRTTDRAAVWSSASKDAPILVAVGENDLAAAIDDIPRERRGDVILVQNELFASVWAELGLDHPTLAVMWLTKKPGQPVVVGRRSGVFGAHADRMMEIHLALGLPAELLKTEEERDLELVSKYAFILTINALGCVQNLTLGEWLKKDRAVVDALIGDALALGQAQAGRQVDGAAVRAAVIEAMENLASYPAAGRTAQARVDRAKRLASDWSLELPGFVKADLL